MKERPADEVLGKGIKSTVSCWVRARGAAWREAIRGKKKSERQRVQEKVGMPIEIG